MLNLGRFFGWKTRTLRKRTCVLNYLISTFGYRRYLEIGVRDPRRNFDKIDAKTKFAVDPAARRPVSHPITSDAFFSQHAESKAEPFDLVFIDGLHLAEQVERDVNNALSHLAENGTIVLHDCNPLSDDAQSEDYDGKKLWNGTVWKAWVKLRAERADLSMQVIDLDHGLGIIRRGRQDCIALETTDYAKMDYQFLATQREHLLNLVDTDTFRSSVAASI